MKGWLVALTVSFLAAAACNKGGLSAELEAQLDEICACETEACVSKLASKMAHRARDKGGLNAEQAAEVSRRTFACLKKVKAKAGGAGGSETATTGDSPPTAPAGAPDPANEPEPEPSEHDKLKDKLRKDVERLSSITSADELAKAIKAEADALCGCEADECAFGAMQRVQALSKATAKVDAKELEPHKAAIGADFDRLGKCYQKVLNRHIAKEQTVSDVGKKHLERTKALADQVCACTDLACAEKALAESAKQPKLEGKTAADGMNDELMGHMQRLVQCQQKLMPK